MSVDSYNDGKQLPNRIFPHVWPRIRRVIRRFAHPESA